MIYTKLDKNNCAKGAYTEEVHGKFKIPDKTTKEEIPFEEYEKDTENYVYSKKEEKVRKQDEVIVEVPQFNENGKAILDENGNQIVDIKTEIVDGGEEVIVKYFRTKLIPNPDCKIPKEAIPISKELWDRHRKINKQQWNGSEWIDYIEPDNIQIEKLKNKLYKRYKTKRNEEVNNLIIELNDIPFNADETSQLRISRAIQILENDDDTLQWIDANNNIQTLTKLDIKQGLLLAGQKQSEIFIKYRTLMNDLENKTLEELKKITKEL